MKVIVKCHKCKKELEVDSSYVDNMGDIHIDVMSCTNINCMVCTKCEVDINLAEAEDKILELQKKIGQLEEKL